VGERKRNPFFSNRKKAESPRFFFPPTEGKEAAGRK